CSLFTGVQSIDQCDPECTVANRYASDPYDCHTYYYCADIGTPSGPYRCSETKDIFDPFIRPDPNNLHEPCMAFFANLCKPRCSPPECHVGCKSPLDVIVDTDRCDTFYLCIPNNEGGFDLHKDLCPVATPYFDGNKCVDDEQDCCNMCVVDCEGTEFGVLLPDPFDCHKYYMCMGDGVDPLQLECPEGESFEIDIDQCVQGSECEPICSEPVSDKVPIEIFWNPTLQIVEF
ncbi:unnamed protein product, partial [Meganyctiphanes norvegica]